MTALRRWLAGAALALASAGAWAHSPVAGMNHFYSGMLHPAMVPAHLIALIALSLWLGPWWPAGRGALFGLMGALAAGLLGSTVVSFGSSEAVVLAMGAAIAVAVAAAWRGSEVLRGGVGLALGLAIGLDSGPDGVTGRPLWLSLAGTWLGVLVLAAFLILAAEAAARPWMRIGMRVVASWVAASAILVLALAVAGPVGKARPDAAAASVVR